jgi:hypothetical protein
VVPIQWFHPVGWCVVLQRYYGGGSRMAVALFGAVHSVSLVSLSARTVLDGGYTRWRRLLAAAARLRSAFVA